MRKALNKTHIEGRVYEHNLTVKKVQNSASENFGKEFISGTLDVATDDACTNIITINFTYVTATTSKNNRNETYYTLLNIIENGKCVIVDGPEVATMVKIDTATALNDFYSNKTGEDVLVSAKRNEGGFVHTVTKLCDEAARNTFEVDMLINGTKYIEADEEKHIDNDYLIIKGAIFNFKEDILPVEFVCYNPAGIKYFESLEASSTNLVFTKVWGNLVTKVIKYTKTEESAFGEPIVKDYSRDKKEWIVTGAAPNGYEIGDKENGITPEEIKEAMAKREIHLAEVKKKSEEYRASQNAATTASAPAISSGISAVQGGFNF